MYFKRKVNNQDDYYLTQLITENFKVNLEIAHNMLDNADEIIIAYNQKHRPIGFLSYNYMFNKNIAYIHYAIIDQSYRGKGIARSFLPYFIKYAKKKGIKEFYGFVSEKNNMAIDIFRHLGFERLIRFPKGDLIRLLL